jgi:serine/threonine protein kinase
VATGTILNNRYILGRQIAMGQICTVYLGTDQILHRKVAIKVVPASHAAIYRQAVRSAACLSHAYIVGLFDVHNKGEELYIIQEYVEGRTFHELMHATLPLAASIEIGEQLAQALVYAHRHGVIHGDLTPQAVFLSHSGTVKINNFGLPPDSAYFREMEMTLAPVIGAMEDISSPPVIPFSQGEDVRAVGFLLYQLAMPYPGKNPSPGEPLPAELRDIIVQAVQRDHPQRIATAEELLAALQACRNELEAAQISQLPTQGFTQPRESVMPSTVPLLQLPQRTGTSALPQVHDAQPEIYRSMVVLMRILPLLVISLVLFAIFFGIGYYLPFLHH